jgi:hypothetical protein
MKWFALFLVAISTMLVVGPASSSTVGSDEATLARLPRAVTAGATSLYGHVKALNANGNRYELRFDPALWLSGVTASRAALEDTGSSDVPNDYYIRDESHRMLTYRVPSAAIVRVLDRQLRSFRITVAQLAQVVNGRNPTGRPLYDRMNGLGFWIVVRGDSVRAIDQQYQP